jgi:DNA-binding NtrC family response regulator
MLSASGSILLAVSATKLGVSEFLRKPINAEQLKDAVDQNMARDEIRLRWIEGLDWLRGGSSRVRKLLADVQEAVRGTKDVMLVGERGIPKEKVAEFLNANSAHKNRRLVKVDMSSFRRESLEPLFWASVQEFMAMPEGSSLSSERERCGTIYLENLDNLDEHFRQAILNFFRERRGKVDKSIRAALGFYRRPAGGSKDYALIEVPPLRERKEDLPFLLELYLKRYSEQYNKEVSYVSTEVLEFLAAHDYPGNYLELERMIQEAVLRAPGTNLALEHFPVDFRATLNTSLKSGLEENLPLEEAKRRFEKDLYHLLLKKTEGDNSRVARFLDVPKSVLVERLKDLVD